MAVVRKDKLLAGYNGNLESVIVHDANDKQLEITNGLFVKSAGLMEGQREVVKGILASEADIAEDVLFIHNSEVMYDERLYKLRDFRIPAGKVARAYRLYDGDIVTLTTDLYTEKVAVGDKLVVKAEGKLGKPDLTANPDTLKQAKVVFEVIEASGRDLDPLMDAFAVKVSRN
ncbi:hypothetical protein [Bacillus mojavensis]